MGVEKIIAGLFIQTDVSGARELQNFEIIADSAHPEKIKDEDQCHDVLSLKKQWQVAQEVEKHHGEWQDRYSHPEIIVNAVHDLRDECER